MLVVSAAGSRLTFYRPPQLGGTKLNVRIHACTRYRKVDSSLVVCDPHQQRYRKSPVVDQPINHRENSPPFTPSLVEALKAGWEPQLFLGTGAVDGGRVSILDKQRLSVE